MRNPNPLVEILDKAMTEDEDSPVFDMPDENNEPRITARNVGRPIVLAR